MTPPNPPTRDRAAGWYWVRKRHDHEMEPAEWDSRLRAWTLYGHDSIQRDDSLTEIDERPITRPTAPGDGLAGAVVTEDERNTLLIALQEHRSAAMRYATNFREDEAQFTEFRDTARRCSALIDRLLGHLE